MIGPPLFTCGSASAAYDSDISGLLTRLPDNNQNLILAKDVRDPIWTLWNQIQMVASQSGSFSQATEYTTATPSSVTIGGILEGMTFSGISFQGIFDLMLHPFVAPIPFLGINVGERQFGDNGSLNLSYYINTGSSPISTITYAGPSVFPISPSLPTGNDPDIGNKLGIVPTYSSTPVLSQGLVFTMSVTTNDLATYFATASTIYKHKRYYGPLNIPMGFTPSIPSSVTAVQAYLTDSVIKGLSFSELSTNVYFSEYMSFTNQNFVFAVPTLVGEPPLGGFHIDFLFSSDYTKIKSGITFSNEYGYLTPYDVWISNFTLNESPVLVSCQNPDSFGNTFEIPTDNYYLVGPIGPTGADGSPVPLQRVAWGTGTGVTGSQYFEFSEDEFNLLSSTASLFTNSDNSVILGGRYHNISNSSDSSIIGGQCNGLTSSFRSSILGGLGNCITNSCNSIILGGNSLSLNNEDDIIFIPSLKVNIAANDNTNSRILTWDPTGIVKYRDLSTFNDISHNAVFSSIDLNVANRFIEIGAGIPSNIVGHVVPVSSTIDYITYAVGVTGSTSSAEVYINGSYSFGLTMSNLTRKVIFGLTQSVLTGDELSVYISGSASQPVVNIHMKG